MKVHLRVEAPLAAAMGSRTEAAAVGAATVFQARTPQSWLDVRAELVDAYRLAKAAAESGSPVVFVVGIDALLGRSAPGPAMIAAGLASAARTLALELKKPGVPVNTVATGSHADIDAIASWVLLLLGGGAGGPTGEVIHLGGDQIGKALS